MAVKQKLEQPLESLSESQLETNESESDQKEFEIRSLNNKEILSVSSKTGSRRSSICSRSSKDEAININKSDPVGLFLQNDSPVIESLKQRLGIFSNFRELYQSVRDELALQSGNGSDSLFSDFLKFSEEAGIEFGRDDVESELCKKVIYEYFSNAGEYLQEYMNVITDQIGNKEAEQKRQMAPEKDTPKLNSPKHRDKVERGVIVDKVQKQKENWKKLYEGPLKLFKFTKQSEPSFSSLKEDLKKIILEKMESSKSEELISHSKKIEKFIDCLLDTPDEEIQFDNPPEGLDLGSAAWRSLRAACQRAVIESLGLKGDKYDHLATIIDSKWRELRGDENVIKSDPAVSTVPVETPENTQLPNGKSRTEQSRQVTEISIEKEEERPQVTYPDEVLGSFLNFAANLNRFEGIGENIAKALKSDKRMREFVFSGLQEWTERVSGNTHEQRNAGAAAAEQLQQFFWYGNVVDAIYEFTRECMREKHFQHELEKLESGLPKSRDILSKYWGRLLDAVSKVCVKNKWDYSIDDMELVIVDSFVAIMMEKSYASKFVSEYGRKISDIIARDPKFYLHFLQNITINNFSFTTDFEEDQLLFFRKCIKEVSDSLKENGLKKNGTVGIEKINEIFEKYNNEILALYDCNEISNPDGLSDYEKMYILQCILGAVEFVGSKIETKESVLPIGPEGKKLNDQEIESLLLRQEEEEKEQRNLEEEKLKELGNIDELDNEERRDKKETSTENRRSNLHLPTWSRISGLSRWPTVINLPMSVKGDGSWQGRIEHEEEKNKEQDKSTVIESSSDTQETSDQEDQSQESSRISWLSSSETAPEPSDGDGGAPVGPNESEELPDLPPEVLVPLLPKVWEQVPDPDKPRSQKEVEAQLKECVDILLPSGSEISSELTPVQAARMIGCWVSGRTNDEFSDDQMDLMQDVLFSLAYHPDPEVRTIASVHLMELLGDESTEDVVDSLQQCIGFYDTNETATAVHAGLYAAVLGSLPKPDSGPDPFADVRGRCENLLERFSKEIETSLVSETKQLLPDSSRSKYELLADEGRWVSLDEMRLLARESQRPGFTYLGGLRFEGEPEDLVRTCRELVGNTKGEYCFDIYDAEAGKYLTLHWENRTNENGKPVISVYHCHSSQDKYTGFLDRLAREMDAVWQDRGVTLDVGPDKVRGIPSLTNTGLGWLLAQHRTSKAPNSFEEWLRVDGRSRARQQRLLGIQLVAMEQERRLLKNRTE